VSDVSPGASKRTAGTGTHIGGGGLRIYKSGQGYYTRVGTAIGAGILVVAGAFYLFGQLGDVIPNTTYALPIKYGVAVSFILVMGAVIYWVTGLSSKTNDFFIATEGEMKKVSWSSRTEVVRSTKVVILSVILLGTFLFVADLGFMAFFSWIGVLHGWSAFKRLFGMES